MSFLVDFFRALDEVMRKSGKDCNTHSPREHRLRHALPHVHGGTNLRIAWQTIVGLWLVTVTQDIHHMCSTNTLGVVETRILVATLFQILHAIIRPLDKIFLLAKANCFCWT